VNQTPSQLYPPPYQTPPPKIETYLVHSILVTLFCCLPLGIPAIVYAANANSKLGAGDTAGALRASQNAKTWCLISLVAGLIVGFGWMALIGFSAMGHLH
jgi:hypothetical protein